MAKKFRVELSKMKRENYVFFCPDAPIHLNLCQPVGYVNRLTSSLLRGIRGKTVIDCDNLVGSTENITPVIEELKNKVENDLKKVTLTYKVINELDQTLVHEVTLNSKKTTKNPSESKGVFTIEVTGLKEGRNTITLHISDEFETVNSEEIVVNITPVNVAPEIRELNHVVNNDAKEVTLTYKVVDDSSQTITHEVTLNGSKSRISPSNQGGTYTHKVTGLIEGNNTIKLHVSDGSLTTESNQISVNITPVNVAPEIRELNHVPNNDAKEVTLTYKVVDSPGQTITHEVTLNGSKNKITPSEQGGTYTHKVTGLIVGNNTIKLHVSDGKLTTDSNQISVDITEVSTMEEKVSEKPKTRRKKKEE